jgi:hypothetical protein
MQSFHYSYCSAWFVDAPEVGRLAVDVRIAVFSGHGGVSSLSSLIIGASLGLHAEHMSGRFSFNPGIS